MRGLILLAAILAVALLLYQLGLKDYPTLDAFKAQHTRYADAYELDAKFSRK